MNKKGFVLSTYVYILLVFFLLLLVTMLAVLNNTKLLSSKLKDQSQNSSGLVDKNFSFVLLGDKDILLKKGDEYVEPSYIAKTSKGVDIKNNVKVIGSVDTDIPNSYTLTYILTYNGVTKELKRNIHVLDDIIVNYVMGLYEHRRDENGLIKDNTDDENIRYAGSNDDVKNYVEFGNEGELWRIIGVFDVASEVGGVPEKRIKIVRENSIGNMSWDSSAETINNGWGVNEWSQADLKIMLNTYYIGEGAACTYCNDGKQATCTNSCNDSVTPINSTYENMIESVVWNTGAIEWNDKVITPLQAYISERPTTIGSNGEGTGKICSATWDDGSANPQCNDTVERTIEWKGKIGLIYPSDFGYAGGSTCTSITDVHCGINNWTISETWYWTISPNSYSTVGFFAWNVNDGDSDKDFVGLNYGVRPSVYLSSNVKIVEGDGTETNPYKLSL